MHSSNATKKRVIKFNEKLKLYAIHRAFKPGSGAFLCCKTYEFAPDRIAVVGDQIFTDIYGGNRVNMYTILVKPIHENEPFVRLKRYPEN